jgi:PTH1 family peptidyl-tRNA hydrolase
MLLSLQLLKEEMMLLSWIRKLFGKKEETDPMKYLLVGLGNMGAEYDDTRHNVGFEIVDALAKELRGKWEHEQLGDLTTVKYKGRTLILLKPSTYMNRSGKSVRYWMQKKKILPENLLVIVDDLNLEFGKIRLRGKGSDGGHNGLKDIQQHIGNDYARLRIGIGGDFGRGRQVDHVLGKWDKKELEQLQDLIFKACTSAKGFATIGLKHAMSQFNG